MKLVKMSREEYKAALDRGEKFTPAFLYERLHAPKDTVFVQVDFGKGLTRIMRKRIDRLTRHKERKDGR